MKFADAKEKLKSMFGDDYYSMTYEITCNHGKVIETKCSLYAAKLGKYYSGATWTEAFRELRKATHPVKPEEIPDE